MIPRNNTAEVLGAFGVALKRLLKIPTEGGYYTTYLGVDYDPDLILRKAADEAGLKMQFPWKTRMVIQAKCLSFAVGYVAEDVYHYPLPDDRWLVTTLRGSDIDKIIEYVNGGTPEFVIEAEPASLAA